jgi:hypothetical protein
MVFCSEIVRYILLGQYYERGLLVSQRLYSYSLKHVHSLVRAIVYLAIIRVELNSAEAGNGLHSRRR